MTNSTGFFRTEDGLSLFYSTARVGAPKPNLVFVHGVGEHIGRYKHVFDWFSARGYSCFGFDLRGFGRSEGTKGHVTDFSSYVADLADFVSQVVLRAADRPVVLFGHSMGSIVVLSAALQELPSVSGLMIFSCPIVQAQWSAQLGGMLAKRMHTLAPTLMVPNFIDPTTLTNDPEVIRMVRHDPQMFGKVSIGWLHAFGLACWKIQEEAIGIVSPILIAHGNQDRVADIKGSQWLFDHVGSTDKALAIFDGFKHELLNHLPADREAVLNRTYQWLEQRFG